MNEQSDRSWWRSGWVLLIGAIVVVAVAAYLGMRASHGTGLHASYQKLVDFITHAQSEKPPAAIVAEARHMDAQFESDLRYFVPRDTKIRITAVTGDTESFAFAQEIAAWLRANGWQHVQGVNQRQPTEKEHIMGTNLRVNPKGGMELIVGPRPDVGASAQQ